MRKAIDQNEEFSLISRMKEGEIDAFDALYWHYQGAVFKNIFNLIKDEISSEDILQEVFISLWENRISIDSNRSLGGWLFTTSYNRAINFLKKKSKDRLSIDLLSDFFSESTLEESVKELRIQNLEKAIESLPQQKKKVFYLCKIEGLSYAETASIMKISKNTVKDHISEAMSIIKSQLLKSPLIALIFAFLK